jgi:LysM repeat protein
MKLINLLIMLCLVTFVACSKSQESSDASDDPAGVEVVDSDDEEMDDEEMGDEEDEELAESDEEDDEERDDEEGDEEVVDSEEGLEEGDEEIDDAELAESEGDGGAALDGGDTGEGGLTGDDMALEGSGGDAGMGADPGMGADAGMGADPGMGAGAGGVAINESMGAASGDQVYTVQANETLMLIAFKLYGDYTRWREIQRLNSDKLGGGTNISQGMQLSYSSQGAGFSWNPAGNPYLIKRGDSLSLISKDVYGTLFKWRKIWDNNKPLIKDPNKIFVGFTIYYLPDDSRDVASGAGDMGGAPAPSEPAPMEAGAAEDDFADDFPEDI